MSKMSLNTLNDDTDIYGFSFLMGSLYPSLIVPQHRGLSPFKVTRCLGLSRTAAARFRQLPRFQLSLCLIFFHVPPQRNFNLGSTVNYFLISPYSLLFEDLANENQSAAVSERFPNFNLKGNQYGICYLLCDIRICIQKDRNFI
jgi:hypothetical protein